jgi:hypothetical protein
MGIERRKAKRQTLHYGAYVVTSDGKLNRECVIEDISATGAKLSIENPVDIPEEFLLFFSERGGPKRFCRVTWRAVGQVGVTFRAT